MATSGAGTETGQVTGTDQALQPPFDERDHHLARRWRLDLYCKITQDHVSFEHIAKAWWIRKDPAKPAVGPEEERASQFLEYLARRKFSREHRGIEKDYWCKQPWAGCALTGDGRVHSVMNITDPELVLYENRIHQLCRDAHRTFEAAALRGKAAALRRKGAARRRKKAERDLMEIGEMLYSVLTRVILTASVLEDKQATQRAKDEALAAVRMQWKSAHASVEEMIQRQARFEYFEGVGLGALLTLPALVLAGWAAGHYGLDQFSEPGEPWSFAAAIIGGAAGAIISVTQRMTGSNALMLDFTAPKGQKWLLGGLRPMVGAIFGAVVYFAIIGGLLAVDARAGKDASIALAFFAVAGFAAGFSERFATDVVERASSGIVPAARGQQAAEKPDELSLLLSEQPRHAETTAVTGEGQAPAPPRRAGRRLRLTRRRRRRGRPERQGPG